MASTTEQAIGESFHGCCSLLGGRSFVQKKNWRRSIPYRRKKRRALWRMARFLARLSGEDLTGPSLDCFVKRLMNANALRILFLLSAGLLPCQRTPANFPIHRFLTWIRL